jgi:hypothetical protein
MKPCDADALSDPKAAIRVRYRFDPADYLVARDHGGKAPGKLAFNHVKVGPTDPAGFHTDSNLSDPGLGPLHFYVLQGVRNDVGRFIKYASFHVADCRR